MNNSKYNDNLLTGWIENQQAFERHKKKLEDIYRNLNSKSSKEFGITNNKAFDLLQSKIKNIYEQQKFNQKERVFEIGKTNFILYDKISNIRKRKNVLLDREESFNEKNQNLKNRIGKLKSLETEKLIRENQVFGTRIITKTPSVSFKKFDEDFHKRINYKHFMKRLDLPNIVARGSSIVKKKLDTTPFARIMKINTFRSNFTSEKNSEEFENNLENSLQLIKIKQNFNK